MSKNIQSLPTVELRQRLDLYRSLQSRGVFDEIMITVMERELEVRNQMETV
jgi:hypothetical protein